MAKKPVPLPRPKPQQQPPQPLPQSPWRHNAPNPPPAVPPNDPSRLPSDDIRERRRLIRSQGSVLAKRQETDMQKMKKGLGFTNKDSLPTQRQQMPTRNGPSMQPFNPPTQKQGGMQRFNPPQKQGPSMQPLSSMDGIDGRYDPPGYADGVGAQNVDNWDGDTGGEFQNMPYDPNSDDGMQQLGKQENAQDWSYSNWLESSRGIPIDERRKHILDNVYQEADSSYHDGQDGPDPQWIQQIMQYGAQQGLTGAEVQAIIDDVRNSRRN